jgi:lanosterol synthase
MEKEKYWKDWLFVGDKGRQSWKFKLPESLKNTITKKSDWDKPEAKKYLEEMDQAFIFNKTNNPNSADLVYRSHQRHKLHQGEDIEIPKKYTSNLEQETYKSARRGFAYYESLQTEHGNWPGDYGGPMFLMPGLIFAAYITDTPFEKPEEVLIIRNLLNHQNTDGGWGIHIEGKSTMFGTVMQYVSLRLLGKSADEPQLIKAKNWIQQNGGATGLPAWGKFYLSLLNLYDWKGNDSLLPELWILPKWIPIHPGRYWCHNRMVYLPMSYAYGHQITTPLTPLLEEIRTEIYTESYDSIDWKKARRKACEADIFQPIHWGFKAMMVFGNAYEKIKIKRFRKKALDFTGDYLDAEDIHTNFVNIGPVNQAMNSICIWHKNGKDSKEFKAHVNRWREYLWVAEDGMKMGGYNGSQLWDAAFTGQALLECELENEFPEMAKGLYQFIEKTQIRHNPYEYKKFFRDKSEGCWPFSTIEHAWPVTDCTSEGMKTALMFNKADFVKNANFDKVNEERLKPAIDWLLSMQNKDGGWASYEKINAPAWIEILNPALVFENIMIEVTYTECSSASLQGLNYFSKISDYRKDDIQKASLRGVEFIKSKQDPDGSWYGCWGVCYTYGTWFGIEGLLNGGEAPYDKNGVNASSEIQRGCDFLVSIQKEDGSWGEKFDSCVEHKYIEHEEGQVINTAWALLALMAAKYPNKEVVEKGIQFLNSRIEETGDFPQEGISGVFNGNVAETYTSYRNVFPLWAMGRFLNEYNR